MTLLLKRSTLTLCASLALLGAAIASEPAAPAKDTTMNEKQELLKKIDALVELANPTPAGVSTALGQKLVFKKVASAGITDRFTAKAARGHIQDVELRVEPKTSRGVLVIIGVSRRVGLTVPEVLARYGDDPEIVEPSHNAPRDVPVYYVYRKPAGKLSLGFSRDKKAALVSAIWNTKPEPAADDE